MAVYSIKDLEKLTGIKAHTIRIWEQRYQLIEPSRTKTNIRYYCDADLKRLMNIALLNRQGVKISKIATLTSCEIAAQAAQFSDCSLDYDSQLDALTIAMIEMDEWKFNHILTCNIDKIGFEQTIISVISPFLERLSLLWLTGSICPIQEQFMTNLLRQKVIAAIDKENMSNKERETKRFLVYAPEGERQELKLLFTYYLLKTRRHQVTYLGNNINCEDLRDAYNIRKPDYIFAIINEPFSKMSIQQYVNNLAVYFPSCQILISGHQVACMAIERPPSVSICKCFQSTIKFIDNIQPKSALQRAAMEQATI